MTNRRSFLRTTVPALLLGSCGADERTVTVPPTIPSRVPRRLAPPATPVIVATWEWGRTVCERAAAELAANGSLLDAIERGINAVELDPSVRSVGVGGLPNAEGVVQLDAMVMVGSTLEAGAVASLERISTPMSAARRVMERTRHILLVGSGALAFARAEGFTESELLTDVSRAEYEAWRARGEQRFIRGQEDHDTVGAIGVDAAGEVIVGMSTSGLAWKLPGRVGDSPLVGAGGYADAEVGAACATGVGEEIIRIGGSHAIVERMRNGLEPQEAIEEVLRTLRRRRAPAIGTSQVAFLAVRRDGAVGAGCLRPGFERSVLRDGVVSSESVVPIS